MSPPGYYPSPMQQVRPAGVSLLAVLYFVQGVLWMIGGFALGLLFVFEPTLALVCGGIGIVIGAIYFLVGWGLWTLKGWARMVALILAIIGLINIPIGTIISIIILWYLFRPEIKAAFGEGPMPMAPGYGPPPAYGQPYQYGQPPAYQQPPAQPAAPAPPQPAQPPAQPAQQPPAGTRFCSSCGASLTPGTSFCANCGTKVS